MDQKEEGWARGAGKEIEGKWRQGLNLAARWPLVTTSGDVLGGLWPPSPRVATAARRRRRRRLGPPHEPGPHRGPGRTRACVPRAWCVPGRAGSRRPANPAWPLRRTTSYPLAFSQTAHQKKNSSSPNRQPGEYPAPLPRRVRTPLQTAPPYTSRKLAPGACPRPATHNLALAEGPPAREPLATALPQDTPHSSLVQIPGPGTASSPCLPPRRENTAAHARQPEGSIVAA